MIERIKDANVFGECIRDIAFDSTKGFGCYSTFDMESDFRDVQSHQSKTAKKIREIISNTDGVDSSLIPVFSDGKLTLGWHWEGDGLLVVSDGKRIAYNNDCKKDHTWKWWKEE